MLHPHPHSPMCSVLTSKIESIMSFELKLQYILCLHIHVPCDEGFATIPLLNTFRQPLKTSPSFKANTYTVNPKP